MLPHKVTHPYNSLHIAVHETAENWGPQREAFPCDSFSKLGLVYKVTRGSHEERFESSKPRNAPQRERLDGLEH